MKFIYTEFEGTNSTEWTSRFNYIFPDMPWDSGGKNFEVSGFYYKHRNKLIFECFTRKVSNLEINKALQEYFETEIRKKKLDAI
jgi:hypothetical protein